MERLNRVIFGILILQIYVRAAPSDVSKLDDIDKVVQTTVKLEDESTEVSSNNKNSTENVREKRWFNPYGLGYPPISPLIYPGNNRDEALQGVYGFDDPLADLHRRVQELANFARQPPPPHIFFPVLYLPPFDCYCNDNPTTNRPFRPTTGTDGATLPSVTERLPPLDDERQNWGFVINETDTEKGGDDFSRPISFDPVIVDKPLKRPPPPVDRGTEQSDSQVPMTPSPPPILESHASPSPPPPPQPSQPPGPIRGPQFPNAPFPPPNARPPAIQPPTACEGAILTCCHQLQVYYDCFAIQGCPNFTFYGNPCSANNILKVISKFQEYYGQRNR